MLSLATVSFSPSSFEISSSAGAIIRHGPHHSAQKSTRTGPSDPRTSEEKLWSVTVLVAMAAILRAGGQRLTSIWGVPSSASRRQFKQARSGGVKQRRADLPAREDHPQPLRIGLHLPPMSVGNFRVAGRDSARLEVNDGYTILLDPDAIHRPGDHASVGQCRGERRFGERTRAEQRGETRVGKDAANLGDNLL